jgi:hypothetical protein
MTKSVAVYLTDGEIDELCDAIAEQIRHWESCGGDDEEDARYARIVASLERMVCKLEDARDQLEDE